MIYGQQLTTRALLRLSGENARKTLHSVSTQDVLTLPVNTLRYGALLSPQGKFLYDFLTFRHDDPAVIYLDIAHNKLMETAQHIHKFGVGANIEFDDLSDEYSVTALWRNAKKQGHADPRTPQLGTRIYTQKGADIPQFSAQSYAAHAINLGIPDFSASTLQKAYPAELNVEDLHGISYNKGCYVGQEVAARLKFKSTPKRRLFMAELESTPPHPIKNGTPVHDTTKAIGEVVNAHENKLLVLIRIAHAQNILTVDGLTLTNVKLPAYSQPLST